MYFPYDGKLPKDMDNTSNSCFGDDKASPDVEGCSTSNQRWRQSLEETNWHQPCSRFSSFRIVWLSCSESSLRFNVYISTGLAFEIKDDLSNNQSIILNNCSQKVKSQLIDTIR